MYEFVMDYAENDELLGAVVSIVGTNLEVILCHFNLISTILDDFDIDMDEIGEEIEHQAKEIQKIGICGAVDGDTECESEMVLICHFLRH